MKNTLLILAALFAASAFADSKMATKAYADRQDAHTFTNAVASAKAYTDQAVVAASAVTLSIATNIVTNVVTRAYVEGLGISGGGGLSTNAVSAIITNHVESGYLCTVGTAGTLVTNATDALRGKTDLTVYREQYFAWHPTNSYLSGTISFYDESGDVVQWYGSIDGEDVGISYEGNSTWIITTMLGDQYVSAPKDIMALSFVWIFGDTVTVARTAIKETVPADPADTLATVSQVDAKLSVTGGVVSGDIVMTNANANAIAFDKDYYNCISAGNDYLYFFNCNPPSMYGKFRFHGGLLKSNLVPDGSAVVTEKMMSKAIDKMNYQPWDEETEYAVGQGVTREVVEDGVTNVYVHICLAATGPGAFETNHWANLGTQPLQTIAAETTALKATKADAANTYTKAQAETASTNASEAVFAANADYALTGGAVLKSGEIAAFETATNLTLTLDFEANGRGADCGAYVENTAASNVTLAVAGGFHVACAGDEPLTLPKASTNLVWFCRVKTNVVVVSRQEVK